MNDFVVSAPEEIETALAGRRPVGGKFAFIVTLPTLVRGQYVPLSRTEYLDAAYDN